ncbi:MAG: hypothetical protein AAGI08_06220, partial [Bacteroidota bacterium]
MLSSLSTAYLRRIVFVTALAFLPIATWGQCVDPANTSGGSNSTFGVTNPVLTVWSGQTFTATCSGFLIAVEFSIQSVSSSPITGTLRVFTGDPNTGTEVTNQGFSLSSAGPQRLSIGTPVAVTDGSLYSFALEVASGAGEVEVSGTDNP